MARQFTKSSGMYLDADGSMAVINAWPVSFCIWYNADDISSNQNIMRLYESGDTSTFMVIQVRSSGNVRFQLSQTGESNINDQTTSTISTGAWNMFGARITSSELEIYLNGSGTGSPTSHSRSADSWDSVVVGATHSGATEADGKLARCAVWTGELSDAEFDGLAGGCDPRLVQSGNLHFWWEGQEKSGAGRDWVGGITLTDHNSVGDAVHPGQLSQSYTPRVMTAPAAAASGNFGIIGPGGLCGSESPLIGTDGVLIA